MLTYLDYVTELIDEDAEIRLGELDGQPAWSDGFVMFLGIPPRPGEPSAFFGRAIESADPGGMPEVHPVAVTREHVPIVWFSDGKTAINHGLFRMAIERFGRVRFFSDGEGGLSHKAHHVSLMKNGNRVGLIARIHLKPEEWPERVTELLRQGNSSALPKSTNSE